MRLGRERMLITGGPGILGSHRVSRFAATGHHDLAVVGGIGGNRARPGEYYYDNLVMGAHLMKYARRTGVAKFVALGTMCSYHHDTAVPFREATLWDEYPEPTDAPYGLAKKMPLVQGQAYRSQYGFNGIYLLTVNLYGPGDDFDPATSHIMPALIRRCVEAVESGATEVAVWGDGTATREFLYVEDAAEAIVLATDRYDGADPVNIGSGSEISIYDLAHSIARATGFTGRLLWDATQPNGQARRRLDTTRTQEQFQFRASTPFDLGLERTVAWYQAKREAASRD